MFIGKSIPGEKGADAQMLPGDEWPIPQVLPLDVSLANRTVVFVPDGSLQFLATAEPCTVNVNADESCQIIAFLLDPPVQVTTDPPNTNGFFCTPTESVSITFWFKTCGVANQTNLTLVVQAPLPDGSIYLRDPQVGNDYIPSEASTPGRVTSVENGIQAA